MDTSIPWFIKTSAQYRMPKGGHAVGTIYMDSEEGIGFMNENFILTVPSLYNVNKINFAKSLNVKGLRCALLGTNEKWC